MAMNYLIDFAYRNICFLNFLETSLKNWNLVLNQHPKENLTKKQSFFRQENDENLIHYMVEEKNCGIYSEEKIQIKTDKIREWAKTFNPNLSKKLEMEEINSFIDKSVYPNVIDKLDSLRKKNNSLVQILNPHLLNNLLASFKLLNKLRMELISKLKKESKNYNELFLKSIGEMDDNKKKLNESKNMLNKANREIEKTKYEEKMKQMQEIIDKLKSERLNQNKTSEQNNDDDYIKLKNKYNTLLEFNNELTEKNQNYLLDVLSLKDENKYLKERLDDVENDLETLKKKVKEMEKQNASEKEQRVKNGTDFLNFINSNHKEMVKHIKIAFNIPEEQNKV